jgi:hypothetical protein
MRKVDRNQIVRNLAISAFILTVAVILNDRERNFNGFVVLTGIIAVELIAMVILYFVKTED